MKPTSPSHPEIDRSQIEATGRLISKAREMLAYAGYDGALNRPLMHESGTYPQFAIRGDRYRLIDSTGRSFIDWVNGWGTNYLGYAHPEVNRAISMQMELGANFALMHPLEIEVASLLVDLVPSAEMVAFGKNGSDAVNAAIRVARAVTQRTLVLQFGFHGFHEGFACLNPETEGILEVLRDYVLPFPYNDIEALAELFQANQHDVAAVMMEPVNMYLPHDGYLEQVAALTRRYGALLIFDEGVTAFRLSMGGAQELFGVTPDLTCLGKAMGNGMPLSALVGKAEYMRHLSSTSYGMTFRGETLSLAAARTVLNFASENNVPDHLAKIGNQLRDGFEPLCQAHGIDCQLSGPPQRMTFVFKSQGNASWEVLRSAFIRECLKRGVLTNGNLLATYAHDGQAVVDTLQVFEQALIKVREAIDKSLLPRKAGSLPHDSTASRVNGFVDHLHAQAQGLAIRGWILIDDHCPDQIHVVLSDGTMVEGEMIARPDIGKAFPAAVNASKSGFRVSIPTGPDNANDHDAFTLVAMENDIERFHCLIKIPSGIESLTKPVWLGSGIVFL